VRNNKTPAPVVYARRNYPAQLSSHTALVTPLANSHLVNEADFLHSESGAGACSFMVSSAGLQHGRTHGAPHDPARATDRPESRDPMWSTARIGRSPAAVQGSVQGIKIRSTMRRSADEDFPHRRTVAHQQREYFAA
jgi:hypothetical protein